MAALADREHVRVFTVGLRSGAFDPSSLQGVADRTGGAYSEGTSIADLSKIYSALGAQLAKEHVISYKSLAPAGAPISVVANVKGLKDPVYASYDAPALHLPAATDATKARAGPRPAHGSRSSRCWHF